MVIPIWLTMLVTIFLILVGLIFKRSRIVTIFLVTWEYILIGFNDGGPDIDSYHQMYVGSSLVNFGFNKGEFWTAWNVLSKNLGLNFIQSHALIMVPVMIIMYVGIRKLTKNVNFVFALMMIYPLPDMVIQRRQVIAMAIIIYALHFLKDKKFFHQICFVGLIIVAYGFHEMSLLFMPLIIVPYLNVNHIFRTMLIFEFLSIFLSTIMMKYATNFFSESKVALYTESLQISKIKTIPFIIIHVAMIMLAYYLSKQKKDYAESNSSDELLLKISMVSIIYTPLYFTNTTFFRYFRSIIPAVFAYLSDDQRKLENRWKFFFISILSVIGFNLFFYVLFGQFGFEGLILPIFRDNALFNPAISSSYFF